MAVLFYHCFKAWSFMDHTALAGVYIDFFSSDKIPNLLTDGEMGWQRPTPGSRQQIGGGCDSFRRRGAGRIYRMRLCMYVQYMLARLAPGLGRISWSSHSSFNGHGCQY